MKNVPLRLKRECCHCGLPMAKTLFMVALWNKADHYIFALWFRSSFYPFFLAYLSGRTLDVYHTSTHDVALVRI